MKQLSRLFPLCLSFLAVTGCCTFHEAGDELQFSGMLSGVFLLLILMFATPKLLAIIMMFSGDGVDKEQQEELNKELLELNMGYSTRDGKPIPITRKELNCYKTANTALFAGVTIPAIVWLMVIFGMGGLAANGIGLIAGIFLAIHCSKKIFLFSEKYRSITIAARLIMLIMAIVFFCI